MPETPFDIDAVVSSLLGMLLDVHPGQLSVEEIARLLDASKAATSEQDDLLVALGDLVGHGLAHRHGDFVFASVAAVRFNELAGPSVAG